MRTNEHALRISNVILACRVLQRDVSAIRAEKKGLKQLSKDLTEKESLLFKKKVVGSSKFSIHLCLQLCSTLPSVHISASSHAC